MKWRDVKNVLNDLTEEQLDGNVIVIGPYEDFVIQSIKPVKEDLYWSGEDDPSELMTEAEMKIRVKEEGEEKLPEVYIKKGQIIMDYNNLD